MIGQQLKAFRESKGISQNKASKVIGLTQARLCHIEMAENLNLNTIQHYVEKLGGQLDIIIK